MHRKQMNTVNRVELKQEVDKLLTHFLVITAHPNVRQPPYLPSLIRLLENVSKTLDNEKPDREILEESAFGIWRLTTDSYKLEKSWTGQSLMEISSSIDKYLKTEKD